MTKPRCGFVVLGGGKKKEAILRGTLKPADFKQRMMQTWQAARPQECDDPA